MHCVHCGASVPEGASFCPNCGKSPNNSSPSTFTSGPPPAEPPSPKKKGKVLGCLGIGFGVLVLLIIIGAIADPKKGGTSSNGAAQNASGSTADPKTGGASDAGETAVAEADLPLAVKASELFNAYQNNEASAQRYFGGRKLFVTGKVEKVSLDFMDKAVVELRTPNQFMNVQASLASDAQDAGSDYNPGQTATLLCEDVSEVASIPMLKDCRPAAANTKTQAIEWRK